MQLRANLARRLSLCYDKGVARLVAADGGVPTLDDGANRGRKVIEQGVDEAGASRYDGDGEEPGS